MSDIFREVDEDIRREQYKKLWERYGAYAIGVAVLIVVGVAGYKGWEYWQERQAQATGDRFVAALRLSEEGKYADAEKALAEIVVDGSGGYPILAGFRIAAEKASAGDISGAVAEYDAIAGRAGTPEAVRVMARLRAALVLVDSADPAEIETRIGDLAATGNPWRHSAREILGLAAFRANDSANARARFEAIVADQEAPADMRQRSQLILALLTAREGAPAPETKPEG
jgi:hypothetical protein